MKLLRYAQVFLMTVVAAFAAILLAYYAWFALAYVTASFIKTVQSYF